jgi:hypothetical protein
MTMSITLFGAGATVITTNFDELIEKIHERSSPLRAQVARRRRPKSWIDQLEDYRRFSDIPIGRMHGHLGVSRGTYWGWRRGRNPNDKDARKILEKTGIIVERRR